MTGEIARTWRRPAGAVAAALVIAALLVALAGADPLRAAAALLRGAFGSAPQLAEAAAKATPTLLCATGIALCFRGRVINIGAEGQLALGGICATWAALHLPPGTARPVAIALPLLAGMAGGMAWAGLAGALHVWRGVHEVLVTLLLNFVALLLVGEVLEDGGLGEAGAGFPQSPLLPRDAWLPRLMPRTDLHAGVPLAVLAALVAHLVLWRTRWGFAIRTVGASRLAARYAGLSLPRTVMGLMLGAGATAGLAGAVQVQGIHHRLIDGFTGGFGFVAVAIALLGGLNPLALIPAALLFGLLETGALSMQRQVGVPSSLVAVIEGMAMLFVLAITARNRAAARV